MALENKVALVTGAGRGMGRAISLALASDGAQVAVSDINMSEVEDTSTALRELGQQSLAIHADVGQLAVVGGLDSVLDSGHLLVGHIQQHSLGFGRGEHGQTGHVMYQHPRQLRPGRGNSRCWSWGRP